MYFSWLKIWVDANVAWPQSYTYTFGVNQRIWKWFSFNFFKKTVSDKFISAAIAWQVLSFGNYSTIVTAAGLPKNGFVVNASTIHIFIWNFG